MQKPIWGSVCSSERHCKDPVQPHRSQAPVHLSVSPCKAKSFLRHTPNFPYVLFESQSSANVCNSTGISTFNSFFLCLPGRQRQTGTEELKVEQRVKRLQKYLTLCCCTYLCLWTKSHIPQRCFFLTKQGKKFLCKGTLWWFT